MYSAIALLLACAIGFSSAQAAPEDPFTGASPSSSARAPAGTNYNVGDWGVSEQRGAATYTFPIDVPPGRNQMQPQLALRYSSQSPLRGGLAAGWSMDLPSIQVDRSLGYEEAPSYQASVNGITGRLVEVPDVSPYPSSTAYRAEFDSTFTRFFKIDDDSSDGTWTALTADGVRHYFEAKLGGVNGVTRWQISRQVDPFGNTVLYHWSEVESTNEERVTIDLSLSYIEYTSNTDAGLGAHAKVEFEYAPLDLCVGSHVPIGAQATGDGLVIGAERVNNIVTYVRDFENGQLANWRMSKRVSLLYDLSTGHIANNDPTLGGSQVGQGPIPCNQTETPLRYLAQIDVAAYDKNGVESKLPPMTFDYARRSLLQFPHQVVPVGGFEHQGTRTGATDTLLDINSDGVNDRVSIAAENGICTMSWQAGLLGGGYESNVRKSALPTAPWLDGALPNPNTEYCNINGQVAYRYRTVIVNGHTGQQAEKGVVSYHFMDYTGDGRLDLLLNIWAAVDIPSYVPPGPGPSVTAASSDGPQPDQPNTPLPLRMQPEKVYRVYRNAADNLAFNQDPDDAFSEVATVVETPWINHNRPFPSNLPPSASDENVDTDQLALTSIPTLIDLDGDGFQDFVDIGVHPTRITDDGSWDVYFGVGTHNGNNNVGFGPKVDWTVSELDLVGTRGLYSSTVSSGLYEHHTIAGLYDINGDRRPDLVVQMPDAKLHAYMNTGTGFAASSVYLGVQHAAEETVTLVTKSGAGTIVDGHRVYRRRLIDVDADGLVDLLHFPIVDTPSQNEPLVHFNIGDRFLPPQTLSPAWNAVRRHFFADGGDWRLHGDLMDGDGDGISDLISYTTGGVEKEIRETFYTSAPKTLRRVENGHGMTMEFHYRPSTDTSVVQWDRDEKFTETFLPMPKWVVSEVTVDPGFAAATTVTRYKYADPAFAKIRTYEETPETVGFLGFRQTTVTSEPADGVPGQRTVRAYAYDNQGSPSGEVVAEWMYGQDGATFELDSYKEIQYTRAPLFEDSVFFVYPHRTLTRSCAAGMLDAACMTQTTNVYRAEETWSPRAPSQENPGQVITSPPSPELYVRTLMQTGAGLTEDEDDKRTRYQHHLRYGAPHYGPEDYRIRVSEQIIEDAVMESGSLTYVPAAKKQIIHDAVTGLPMRVHAYLDGTTVATTEHTYDAQTGNRLSQTQPNEVANGSGKMTTYTYDGHQIYVESRTNELGHLVTFVYDVATGSLLERQGPNSALDANGDVVFEKEDWVVDGFGRQVEHAITAAGQGTPYELFTVQKTTYFDDELPNRVRTETLRDFGGSVWVTADRTMDGLGRLMQETTFLDNGQTSVTTHGYDGAGNLATIDVPDPRVDDGSTVRHRYAFDGLGRLVSFTQPDGNGVVLSYDGLEETIQEVTSDGSGAMKKQVYDVFGHPVELHEFYPGDQTAITHYRYDVVDNLVEIVDADGNVTTLDHDWLGNRISVARDGRVWQYAYDLNGNLVEEIAPIPPGEDPKQFTASRFYDALNRLTEVSYDEPTLYKIPKGGKTSSIASGQEDQPKNASRSENHRVFLPVVAQASADADRVEHAPVVQNAPHTQQINAQTMSMQSATVRYFYDQGENGIGRLHEVELPFGTVTYSYDPRGLIVHEQRSMTVNGPQTIQVAQSVQRAYNALGQRTLSTWDDGQQWRTQYDERGLIATVEWFDQEQGIWAVVAGYERGLSGLPRVRNTDYNQTRQYAFDMLARPVDDLVLVGGTPIATRQYSYGDAGDLLAVTGAIRGESAAANYSYDVQHRLRTATGPNGYSASFEYSPAGNIETANVTWIGTQVARNVRYEYGNVDAQAVDQLVDVNSGAVYADFSYDLSGNMTQRNIPSDTQTLSWDAMDRVRKIEGANGAETYYYDHMGQRILAYHDQTGIRFWFGESETHIDLDGKQFRRYLHLADGGSVLARVENGKTIELQYADSLRNLMFSLDAHGGLVASFLYGAFGEVVYSQGESDHRRQFNGKENDVISGLRYYGYRYYDPLILRWNSADPLYRFVPELSSREPGRYNLYSFSLNNPLTYLDPDGRNPGIFHALHQLWEFKEGVEMGGAFLKGLKKGSNGEWTEGTISKPEGLDYVNGEEYAMENIGAIIGRSERQYRYNTYLRQQRKNPAPRSPEEVKRRRKQWIRARSGELRRLRTQVRGAIHTASNELQRLKDEREGILDTLDMDLDAEEREYMSTLLDGVEQQIEDVEENLQKLNNADEATRRGLERLKQMEKKAQ